MLWFFRVRENQTMLFGPIWQHWFKKLNTSHILAESLSHMVGAETEIKRWSSKQGWPFATGDHLEVWSYFRENQDQDFLFYSNVCCPTLFFKEQRRGGPKWTPPRKWIQTFVISCPRSVRCSETIISPNVVATYVGLHVKCQWSRTETLEIN